MGRRTERSEVVRAVAADEIHRRQVAALRIRARDSGAELYETAGRIGRERPDLEPFEVWEAAFEHHGLTDEYENELKGTGK